MTEKQKPTAGRIVHYTLNEYDAERIERVRSLTTGGGEKPFIGNTARAGDVVPMMVVRPWTDSAGNVTCVNGQAFLDGNDTLWVTSVAEGTGTGTWCWPPRA